MLRRGRGGLAAHGERTAGRDGLRCARRFVLVRGSTAAGAARTCGPGAALHDRRALLLQHVSDLVRQQRHIARVRPLAEDDVMAVRECACAMRQGQMRGRFALMHAHVAQVGAESRLELTPHVRRKRFAGTCKRDERSARPCL